MSHRVLMFVAVLGVSAGLAVLAAHQDDSDVGGGIVVLGLVAIVGTLWFVAYRRARWHLRGGYPALAGTMAGLAMVIGAGSSAVSEVVLAARGELVDVVVTQAYVDERGRRWYALTPVTESTSVRGNLTTKQEFDDGQTVTVLVDRAGFVRPRLPADTNTVLLVIFVLAGVASLAASMIGSGFPLSDA